MLNYWDRYLNDHSDGLSIDWPSKSPFGDTSRLEGLPMDHPAFEEHRNNIIKYFEDVFGPPPDELPPFREVNHRIPLIDPGLRYKYRLPKCPEAYMEKLQEKINFYVSAGKWVPMALDGETPAPMMVIPKPRNNNKIRTVIDARQRNNNTFLDATPLPSQEVILNGLARATYRSKIDMTDAYEQVRIVLEDINKTYFSTPMGTFVSMILQQGDCNGPSTFQRLMSWVFRHKINNQLWVYFDDIFNGTDTVLDHDLILWYIHKMLKENKLYISREKFNPYRPSMECLGHIVDDIGIHADHDKMKRIRDWVTPKSKTEVLRFLGLVEYVSKFMPNVSNWSSTLSAMSSGSKPFVWLPIHQKCFDEIKRIACKSPILKPLDWSSSEKVFLICDASAGGVGAVLAQGNTWENSRPASFMSKKFTNVQRNYGTHEHEVLAILEGLLKWEDQLLGRKFTIVTDHESLTFFKTKDHDSARRQRWQHYLDRFVHELIWVEGETNKVADCLSRYFLSDERSMDLLPYEDLVNADIRLDKDGDDLPIDRRLEHQAQLKLGSIPNTVHINATHITKAKKPRHRGGTRTVKEVVAPADSLNELFKGNHKFIEDVKNGYKDHRFFKDIVDNINEHKGTFNLDKNGLLWIKNTLTQDALCVPNVIINKRNLGELVITSAHQLIGHLGSRITNEHIRRYYWWPSLTSDVKKLIDSCKNCQANKSTRLKYQGLLHTLPVPDRPWQSIAMDFMGPLPISEGYTMIWVIIDRLTSMTHIVPIKDTITANELAYKFLDEVVRLHGLPESIVSDRDTKFTSAFWTQVHEAIGVELKMSTSFHQQTDGMSERAIQTITQILRSKINIDQDNWSRQLSMTEFAINSTVKSGLHLSAFEDNYGYQPSMLPEFSNAELRLEKGINDYLDLARHNIMQVHDELIAKRARDRHNANKHRREEPKYNLGDKVWLSTTNLAIPTGRARKFIPRFIGPFAINKIDRDKSNYTLELPIAMVERGLHATFHASLIKPYISNEDDRFPNRINAFEYDMGQADEDVWEVKEITNHRWKTNRSIEFDVLWSMGDSTWEPFENVKHLSALDEYLGLKGVRKWRDLPKKPIN